MDLKGQMSMGLDAALGILGRRRPVNVMVSITDRCCSRCSYCQIPEQGRPDLSTEQWKELFRQMASAGTRRIGIWGGEPLMRRDMGELCSFARSLGMYVSLDSNGYLLPQNPGILDDIDHLVLAYDGPEEAHDTNREPGSHGKVMRAMETASGKVRLWTITVLTRHNIRHLDHIMETALKYGFQTTFQTLHHNEKLGGDTSGMMPERDEYVRTYGRLLEMKRNGAPIANSTRYLRSLTAWPDFSVTRMEERFHGVSCRAGRMYCNIDADGKVYPCSLLIGLYPGSVNALETGFSEAFGKTADLPCQACTASCYTEYNFLYGLCPSVALEWHRSVKETDRMLREKIEEKATSNGSV
ncbi:MAG: radical SAM protein [Candidatus Fermentibacteraceae bacterium]|nr:radical SAM protein [Candidatus Fermentibacteraceae bacterium]MBN2609670.1 radical SAM protein [Candidatus Fermentibacteraceae bacterium]